MPCACAGFTLSSGLIFDSIAPYVRGLKKAAARGRHRSAEGAEVGRCGDHLDRACLVDFFFFAFIEKSNDVMYDRRSSLSQVDSEEGNQPHACVCVSRSEL